MIRYIILIVSWDFYQAYITFLKDEGVLRGREVEKSTNRKQKKFTCQLLTPHQITKKRSIRIISFLTLMICLHS